MPPFSLRAAEYSKPAACAFSRSTTSQRSGPTLFGPPFSKLWQAAQALVPPLPLSASALASRTAMGSAFGASAAAPPLFGSGSGRA